MVLSEEAIGMEGVTEGTTGTGILVVGVVEMAGGQLIVIKPQLILIKPLSSATNVEKRIIAPSIVQKTEFGAPRDRRRNN